MEKNASLQTAASPDFLDALIIGAGPAGIAVAHTLQQAGLRCRIHEQGPVAWHIAQYPTFMEFFSTRGNLEIADFPLGVVGEKPSRREYLKYLTDFVAYHKIDIRTYSRVTRAERLAEDGFAVTVARRDGTEEIVRARTVVVAVGAWEQPRGLGVPGADLPKVRTRFAEAHEYIGQRVLVVGGRNSAIEAALQLWRAGAHVSLSYRGTEFTGRGVKYWLAPDIENRLKNGEIGSYLGTTVARVDWDTVTLRHGDGREVTIGNDFVLPFLGYDPPVAFLKGLGIEIEPETNIPKHNPDTLETNVSGLFVAGTIVAGNVSGNVFIENSRHHGEMMVQRIKDGVRA